MNVHRKQDMLSERTRGQVRAAQGIEWYQPCDRNIKNRLILLPLAFSFYRFFLGGGDREKKIEKKRFGS